MEEDNNTFYCLFFLQILYNMFHINSHKTQAVGWSCLCFIHSCTDSLIQDSIQEESRGRRISEGKPCWEKITSGGEELTSCLSSKKWIIYHCMTKCHLQCLISLKLHLYLLYLSHFSSYHYSAASVCQDMWLKVVY